MEDLKKLLSGKDRVWFYVQDEDGVAFLQWAKDNGCKWMNGDEIKPDQDNCGYHMGIDPKLSMGFVSGICWGMGSRCPTIRVVKFKELLENK